ncbi:MAG: right-handed parallel beta-helix repeat-containing protein [Planctomycetota bacterium]
MHAGLISAAAGSGEVRVHWDPPASGFEFAIFHNDNSAAVLSGTQLTSPPGTSATISGLANGATRYFAMGIRPTGSGGSYTLSGRVLRAVPFAPIYVDANAGTNGIGTLGSPFNNLQAAATAAAGLGGGNLWLRDGTYGRAVLSPGTHVYGGFPTGSAFTLANRNFASGATIVTATAGLSALDISLVGDRVVVDGLAVAGNNTALYGIDTEDTDLEVRSVTVRNCVDRGIRMRNSRTTETAVVELVNVASQQNGADGVSVLGAYSLFIDACSFDSNVQEGIDCGPLVALNGAGLTSTVVITASRFANNGAEGLDASLDAPLTATGGAGAFDITIAGCNFTGNALDGCLIDQEHERLPGWTMRCVVRDCTASDNGLAGFHVDYDSAGEVLLHRNRASANGTDGVFISSEVSAGHAVVSACDLVGNLGAGMRTSLGNKVIAATHCVFSGNAEGGFLSLNKQSTATNCIFRLQANATQNVRLFGSATVTDPAAAVFQNAPNGFAKVLSHTNGALGLEQVASFAAGATVELADNGTAFAANQVNGTSVVLSGTPALRRTPAALAAFPSANVTENLQLAAGSVVAGLGMIEDTGFPAVNPGPFGAPAGGTPGTADQLPGGLLWVDQVTPAPQQTLGSTAAVTLRFSSALNAGSISGTRVRVRDTNGNPVAAGFAPSFNSIQVNPPGGGWPAGALNLEVHVGITGSAGVVFSAPIVVPLR